MGCCSSNANVKENNKKVKPTNLSIDSTTEMNNQLNKKKKYLRSFKQIKRGKIKKLKTTIEDLEIDFEFEINKRGSVSFSQPEKSDNLQVNNTLNSKKKKVIINSKLEPEAPIENTSHEDFTVDIKQVNKGESRRSSRKLNLAIIPEQPAVSIDDFINEQEYTIEQIDNNNNNLQDIQNQNLISGLYSILKIGNKKKFFDIKGMINKKKNRYMSILDNMDIKTLNHSACRITKYFKNQTPLNSSNLKGDKFTDCLFPPNNNSIIGLDSNGKPTDQSLSRYNRNLAKLNIKIDDIIWIRPEDIFPGGKYTIFEGSIDIDDVNQGSLGNCYFLSAIAAMCEYPQMVSEIFRQFTVNGNGYYEVVFNINGVWEVVIIDDYFPCFKSNKNPIFSKPNNSELWVLILEKAWAKINGGYLNIIGGWPCEVYKSLTPFCVKSYNNKDNESILFDIIYESDQEGFIMACSSIFSPIIERKGLISGHAFTIISAHDEIIKGNQVRLLRIRNPWGYQEWNGPWSDDSIEWDEEAKSKFVDYINQEDGTFFIEYSDYIENFLETQICRVISPCCTKSEEIPIERLYLGNIYEFFINRSSLVDISIIRKSYRFNRDILESSDMIINLIVAKKTDRYNIIKIECENENDPVLDLDLNPGHYIIYVLCNKNKNNIDKDRPIRLYIVSNNYFLLQDKGTDTNFTLLSEMVKFKCGTLPVNNQSLIHVVKNKISDKTTIGVFYLKNCSGNERYFRVINETQNFTLLNEFSSLKNSINDSNALNPSMINMYSSIKKTTKAFLQDSNKSKDFKKNTKKFTKLEVTKSFYADTEYNQTEMNKTSNDNNFIIALKSEEEFILIGQRTLYYNEYWFNINFEEISKSEATKTKLLEFNRLIDKDFIENITKQSIEEEFLVRPVLENYDYFFKRHDININEQLAITIDDIDINKEYFEVKYPEFMSVINEMDPIDNLNENVKFMDLFDSGYGIYFGEWKVSKLNVIPVKHGRGLTLYEDGSRHVGYYFNDEFHGKGKFVYKDGTKIEINFKDGKMHGQGLKIIKGISKIILYNDGNLIKLDS